MWRYFLGSALDAGEHFAEPPRKDLANRWLGGGLAAGALAAYALRCIVLGQALMFRTGPLGIARYEGASGSLLGAIYLCGAAFLRFHWFWSGEERWHFVGQLGKLLSLVGLVAALAALLYRELWLL